MAQDVDILVPRYDRPQAEQRDAGLPIRNGDAENGGWLKRLSLKYIYFPILRGLSYGAESLFRPLSDLIADKTVAKDEVYIQTNKEREYAQAVMVKHEPDLGKRQAMRNGGPEIDVPSDAHITNLKDAAGITKDYDAIGATALDLQAEKTRAARLRMHKDRAKVNVSRWETVAFLGWTLLNFFGDRKQLKADLAPAVAIEMGKSPDDISLRDIWSSTNGMAGQSMRRFATQNVMRSVTDLFFLRNVHWGIGAKAVGITYERLLTETILDSIRNQVARTQNNHLGEIAKPDIVKTLKTTLRRSRQFLKLEALSEQEVMALDESFSRIADGIIQRKLAVPEVVYLIGSKMAHNPYKPDMLLQEVDAVMQGGLAGLSKKKSALMATYAGDTVETQNDTVSPTIHKIVQQGERTITPDRIKELTANPAAGLSV